LCVFSQSRAVVEIFEKFKDVNRSKALIELETTTVYWTVKNNTHWQLKNITAKNVSKLKFYHKKLIFSSKLCKLVISAPQVIKNTTFKWPLPLVVNKTDTFPINDFDYLRARVRAENIFNIRKN
jgi:hypothetical protein